MKKLMILLLCCLALTGCGNQGVSQEEYDKVVAERDGYKEQLDALNKNKLEGSIETGEGEEKDKTEKSELEKQEVSNLYETEGLKELQLGDITVKIPQLWEDDVKTSGNWTYYYYKDLMFATMVKDENEITNENLILGKDDVADGMIKDNGGKVVSDEIINISGKEAIEIHVEQTVNEKTYNLFTIVFVHNNKLYNIGWMIEKESKNDYSKDYETFKETIFIGEEKPKEDTLLYEDEKVRIYFKEISEKGVEFWAENLTDVNITIQADSVSINGISTNDIMMSDDVAPQSKGKVIAKCEDFSDVGMVETVGGQLRVIDFNRSFETYDATFVNVPIQ